MTKPFSVPFISAIAILFACAATPAFANHGGGGHGGGGFHGGGGGGFHSSGGGGFRSGPSFYGGGFRAGTYSPPPAGVGAPRSVPSSPLRSGGGSFQRPGSSFSRPYSNPASGDQRMGNSISAPPAVADGQWHSFDGPAGSRGPVRTQSEAGPSGSAGGWHVLSGNRAAAGSSGAVRSFSGQGREVWENTPIARNVVPKSQSLSSIQNSFRGAATANSGLRSNSTLFASSRFGGGSTFVGGSSGGLNTRGAFQLGASFRIGYPYYGFRGRCWNCSFGFGFGFGWWPGWGYGWPWLGFWGWDPFWYDQWWGWPGYGYYGYPPGDVYGYPYSYNDSAPPTDDNSDYNYPATDSGASTQQNTAPTANAANLVVPVLIYMKNGAVYTVRDYWIIDGELHYILINGVQNSVNLDRVDLPRTNDENAKSGVRFIFKSEPSITAPPEGNAMPPAQPGSEKPSTEPGGPGEPSPEPAPSQQINAIPQPEART